MAATTTPPRSSAIAEISLPAKSAIARVSFFAGSWRNTSARSLVPNQTPPSDATATAVTRLSPVANTSFALPPLIANSLPSGPVPAHTVPSLPIASDQIDSTPLSGATAVALPVARSTFHSDPPGIAPA